METRNRGRGRSDSRQKRAPAVGPYNGASTSSRDRGGRRSPEDLLFSKQLTFPFILLFVGLVFAFVKHVDNRLPEIISEAELPLYPNSFIGERARRDLIGLTNFGPRVCGSHENDVRTVEILRKALVEIQRTKLAVYNVEFEITKHSGAFPIKLFNREFTNSYANVPLVIAKLEPVGANDHANNSVLLNCHFDSVPGSPGASDDMISCVTMLEVLRVLSRQSKPLRNTIIFLFNGAEENFLQGSHAFIAGRTKGKTELGHRWKNNIKTVINLEACGAGGREILFQTGPGNGWLVEAYANSVPYPFGTAMGEEIFQRGLIPSDTDYRVFRDFLHIPGLDFAFIKNGWVYHTILDSIEAIPLGSIQHMGANILALTEYLGNLDFSELKYTETKMVFCDIFGFFMFVYSEATGIVINVVVSLLTLALIWKDANRDTIRMVKNVVATLAAWSLGIILAIFVAILLNLFGYPMPFYSNPSFAYLLFGIPTIVGQVLAFSYLLEEVEDQTWMAIKTTLALLSLSITFFSRLAFVLTLNVGFGILGWVVARNVCKESQRRMLVYLAIGEMFPLAMSFYFSIISIDVFVPIMGRSGTETDPNIFLAVFTAFTLSIPGLSGIVPILVFLKKSFFRGSAIIYLLVIATVVIGIGRIPYTDKTPMRLHLVETDRNYFDTDLKTVKKTEAGFWFFNLDPNIPKYYPTFSETIPEIDGIQEYDNKHCKDLGCGLPWFFPVSKVVRKTHVIPKKTGLPAAQKSRVNMEITEDQFLSQSRRRITFSFSGTAHLTIIFSPGPNYDLVKWSLTPEIQQPNVFWQDRPTYFIKHGRGVEFERLDITCDFERKSGEAGRGTVVDISLSSFAIEGEEMKTKALQEFISKLPSWTHPLAWGSVTNLYTVV